MEQDRTESGKPVVQSTSPDKQDFPVRKTRRESEAEREMKNDLFIEHLVDDINILRNQEVAVFGHMPKFTAWRDEALVLGGQMIDDSHIRQIRVFTNRQAKKRGLSDPDSLESRTIHELSIRMGRYYMALLDQREEGQKHTGYPIPKPTFNQVLRQFFGPNLNRIEMFNPKGHAYSVSSVVSNQAVHIRKIMGAPDSGNMILMGDLHDIAPVTQTAQERRKARMERELGASLDNPEKYINGQWVPVEGHDPTDEAVNHVLAYMRSDGGAHRPDTKGWHQQGGAISGSVVQSLHDVTLMRAADTKWYSDFYEESLRRAWQAVIRIRARNGYANRKMASTNPDEAKAIYKSQRARDEEIILRLVEGLKQAAATNPAVMDLFPVNPKTGEYKPNVMDYLLGRYIGEEIKQQKTRYVGNPSSVFEKPGTKVIPGMDLPPRSMPVWNPEKVVEGDRNPNHTIPQIGAYDWEPDGIERKAQGFRFGPGWDIGRMGDVTLMRRMNYETMAKETNVPVADLKAALRRIAGSAIKLTNQYIDSIATGQAERDSRLADWLNTYEPAEGMQLVVRAPEYRKKVLHPSWGRHGTDLSEGFVPGISEFPYEKRTEVTRTIRKDGQDVTVRKVTILLNMVHVATQAGETCPTCEERPIRFPSSITNGTFHNGAGAAECAECRGVEVYVRTTPKVDESGTFDTFAKSWAKAS